MQTSWILYYVEYSPLEERGVYKQEESEKIAQHLHTHCPKAPNLEE